MKLLLGYFTLFIPAAREYADSGLKFNIAAL